MENKGFSIDEIIDALDMAIAKVGEGRKKTEDECEVIAKRHAEFIFKRYRNYVDAGFSEEQAFELVLVVVNKIGA